MIFIDYFLQNTNIFLKDPKKSICHQKCILDIDDCQPNPCSQNCNQNAPGQGYNCSCAPGKKLDIDQRSCIGKTFK